MTQLPPLEAKRSNRLAGVATIMLVVGVVVGFVLGVWFGPIIVKQSGVGTNNQVQVSGTVPIGTNGTLLFSNLNETIKTSAPIINGGYSVLLVGGQSYNVELAKYPFTDYNVFYVPLGVTIFTQNLVPTR